MIFILQVSTNTSYTTELASNFASAVANQTDTVFASFIAQDGAITVSNVSVIVTPVIATAATDLGPTPPIFVATSGTCPLKGYGLMKGLGFSHERQGTAGCQSTNSHDASLACKTHSFCYLLRKKRGFCLSPANTRSLQHKVHISCALSINRQALNCCFRCALVSN